MQNNIEALVNAKPTNSLSLFHSLSEQAFSPNQREQASPNIETLLFSSRAEHLAERHATNSSRIHRTSDAIALVTVVFVDVEQSAIERCALSSWCTSYSSSSVLFCLSKHTHKKTSRVFHRIRIFFSTSTSSSALFRFRRGPNSLRFAGGLWVVYSSGCCLVVVRCLCVCLCVCRRLIVDQNACGRNRTHTQTLLRLGQSFRHCPTYGVKHCWQSLDARCSRRQVPRKHTKRKQHTIFHRRVDSSSASCCCC